MNWQPIETAPKDGTNVIVMYDFAGVKIAHIAFYRGEQEWRESGRHTGSFSSLREWLGWWSHIENSITQQKLDGLQTPTHWIPMPEDCDK